MTKYRDIDLAERVFTVSAIVGGMLRLVGGFCHRLHLRQALFEITSSRSANAVSIAPAI